MKTNFIQRMTKAALLVWSIALLLVSWTQSSVYAQAQVPEEYYPNFHIDDEWELLLDYFVEVEASTKVGAELQEELFRDILDVFESIFDYFPQSSKNEIVYRQCKISARELSSQVSRSKYSTFKDRCFAPLGQLIKEIETKYKIKAKIKAKPTEGSAPLNVTLDARESTDPSDDTIPSDNFYRYYRDVNGDDRVIGRWPVVNYTFTEPANHVVHLTVRSSNNYEDWIFDGNDSVDINVAPKAANMVVFANGKKLSEERLTKIGSQDAKEGVLIDGTATVPTGARTILEHKWKIENPQANYKFQQTLEGTPRQFIHVFPSNGLYKVLLEITDNEGNRLEERYDISVSDPVALIKSKPEKGTTSTEFHFDASASYSITSTLKKFQWQITDPNWKQTDLVESRNIKRRFSIPGTYSIKLTVFDDTGATSYDTLQLYVWSTTPVPTFIIEPQSKWKYPSQYILDASASFDEDVRTGTDELTYSWYFSNSDAVTIDRSLEEDSSKIRVSMNESWIYKARLVVEDKYGERNEIEKEIKVESTLRPEVIVTPQVTTREEEVTFVAKVNQEVAFYEWDFGDGKKQQSKDPKVSHTYPKAWAYEVVLTVVTDKAESNQVTIPVFMGQKDMPVIGYLIKGKNTTQLKRDSSCETHTGATVEAYEVDRYQDIFLDASVSRNAQGKKDDMKISFHPKNDQVYGKEFLNYNFLEVGCSYVDIFAEDSNLGKTAKETVWFNVVNAHPILQNVTISFPQTWWGNPLGAGSNASFLWEAPVFSDPTVSSIIVKVSAKGARDPDWFISHFKWYYYPSNDPSKKEGFMITPGDVPYTTFIIPKPPYPTEYTFGTELVDNNDARTKSEDILWTGPVFFINPGEESLDIPIATLKVNALTVRAGEEVSFTADAEILSERPDFEAQRYFKFDFDWDSIYDIPSTKRTNVKHTYTKAGKYQPSVSVYYRWRAWVGTTEPLTVLKWLKPSFVISSYWKTALVKDFSLWDITHRAICMDSTACDPVPEWQDATEIEWWISDQTEFTYTYEKAGDYIAKILVIDEFWNQQTGRQHVKIGDSPQGDIGILSVPQAEKNSQGEVEIPVSGATNNSVDIFIAHEQNCFLDLDVTGDSNGDGDPTFDEDIPCNELTSFALFPTAKTQTGRLYFVLDGSIKERDVLFSFLDFEDSSINEEWQRAADKIDTLLQDHTPIQDDQNSQFYRDILKNMKWSLGTREELSGLVIQLRQLVENNPNLLNDTLEIDTLNLIDALSNSVVQEVYGGTEYAVAKKEITIWFTGEAKDRMDQLFSQFEKQLWNKDQLKATLDDILNLAWEVKNNWNIDEVDFNHVINNLCKIIVFYDLPSKTCWTDIASLTWENIDEIDGQWDGDTVTEKKTGKKSLVSKILKRFLWILALLVVVFIVFVVLFAIKARKQKEWGWESE